MESNETTSLPCVDTQVGSALYKVRTTVRENTLIR